MQNYGSGFEPCLIIRENAAIDVSRCGKAERSPHEFLTQQSQLLSGFCLFSRLCRIFVWRPFVFLAQAREKNVARFCILNPKTRSYDMTIISQTVIRSRLVCIYFLVCRIILHSILLFTHYSFLVPY